MSWLNKKILLAPVLAIALVFLLVGAISSLPFVPQNPSQGQLTPTNKPQQMDISGYIPIYPILFAAAAIAVGIVVAFLFFREKISRREVNE